MDEEPEEELVESGSFRIDRHRAIEKLSRFQADGALRRLGLWLRCAVAAGASEFVIDGGLSFREYRFDGTPFTPEELADPYAVLFNEETEVEPRLRFAALALLNSYHRAVSSVELVSGTGKRRIRLSASRAGAEEISAPGKGDAAEDRTTVRVRWSLISATTDANHPAYGFGRPMNPAQHPLWMSPIPVRMTGSFRAMRDFSLPLKPAGAAKATSDPRIHVEHSWNVTLLGPRFFIGTYGVEVEPLEGIRAPITLSGWIDDPLISLDASFSRVIKNERYERAKALLQAEVDKIT